MALTSIQNNRISVTLTQVQIDALRTAFATLEGLLTFAQPLTIDERKRLPKMNVSNKVFVEDAINAINNNAAILPSYLNAAELTKDFTVYGQLDEFVQRSRQLCERFDDTQMLSGNEAYVSALTAYRLFEAAANAGLTGADSAYAQLKTRFKNQGTPTPIPENGQPTT
ncbi:MAG: hypothetical protein ACM3H8_09505 [Sphingobacteriales bacterium]